MVINRMKKLNEKVVINIPQIFILRNQVDRIFIFIEKGMPEEGQIKWKYIKFSYLITQLLVEYPKLLLNGVFQI